MTYEDNLNLWLNQPNLDSETRNQISKMNNNELQDAFSMDLEFGTAGLRGLIGSGTNRMNIYIIRKATIAFAQYLINKYPADELKTRGIVVGHDNRHFSDVFTLEIAKIFSSKNIKVWLFDNNDPRPTPLVSYSVRKVNALGGIVVTASHNSREYNGYKVYDQYGCQLLPVETDQISAIYKNITTEIFESKYNANNELIEYISKSIEQNYINDVKDMQFYPNQKRNIKIVFSNLHGTSKIWTPEILKDCGYEVIVVKEQYEYDPNFTYAPNPNPELLECYDLALKYAKEHDADLIILNDPDADRLGIGVKTKNNDYYLLTGNETAPIALEYLLSHYKKNNTLPSNAVMYNTFVTGNLSDKVAESYGVKVIKTLTGFKWIGSQMLLEKERNLQFIFGFEEAYGYVMKDITRDKDGIQSSIVLAEACWYYLNQNKTLCDVLEEIYQKFGYYYCYTVNLVRKGIEGKAEIQNMLDTLRNNEISSLNGLKCIRKEDYLEGLFNMPPQDLLKFYFEDGSWFAVRASGTEPKIKFYFVCVDNSVDSAKEKMKRMYQELETNYLS